MSQFELVKIVAAREFRIRLRSVAFLASLGISTLLILAAVIIPSVAGDDVNEIEIGVVVGPTDELRQAIESLPSLTEEGSREDVITIVEYQTEADAEAGLVSGEVEIALMTSTRALVEGGGFFGQPGAPTVVRIGSQILQLQNASIDLGLSIEELAALTQSELVVDVVEGEEVDDTKSVVAYLGMMATYMAIMLFGTWTMSGVMEEKTSKVVEIIVSTLRPKYLLAGKVIGIGGLAVLQILFLAAFGFTAVRISGVLDSVGGLPTSSLIMLGLWFLVGFTFYNTLFAATGALISRLEDAQSASMPITLVAAGSMMVSFAALSNPDGILAVIATFVPLSAPFVVPIRFAFGAISTVTVIASLITTIVFAVLAILGAGRIYEGALLRSGGRVRLRQAWKNQS